MPLSRACSLGSRGSRSVRCAIGSWWRPASESGRLRHADGGHGRGDRPFARSRKRLRILAQGVRSEGCRRTYPDEEDRMGVNETFLASPHPGQERQVLTAWDRFLRGAELPPEAVRAVIERSWLRCLSAGVDPGRSGAASPTPDEDLSGLRHRHRDFVDASTPIMEQARGFLSESGTMMILTDPAGVILRTEGDLRT